MHTVHFPQETKNGFIAAAMGLMFSVDDYTAKLTEGEQMIIDTFFETLQWDSATANPTVDLVSYGNLMTLANFNERWVYKGSVTTPPCATNVYWNVVSTIYPVKQKYVDQFKTQLAKVTGLDKTGNWREIQPING
jgi:carbonic anhydrase